MGKKSLKGVRSLTDLATIFYYVLSTMRSLKFGRAWEKSHPGSLRFLASIGSSAVA